MRLLWTLLAGVVAFGALPLAWLGSTHAERHARAHALREAGIVAALAGNEKQARRYFDESLRLADQYEAKYDHAKTTLAQGMAGQRFKWDSSDEQVARAKGIIKELEDVERDDD